MNSLFSLNLFSQVQKHYIFFCLCQQLLKNKLPYLLLIFLSVFILLILPIPFTFSFFFSFFFLWLQYMYLYFFLQFNTFYCIWGWGEDKGNKILIDCIIYFSSLLPILDISPFYFIFLLFITEEVSARIVQVVTAEAVAVLKGEQEKEVQHKDQPVALPLGK